MYLRHEAGHAFNYAYKLYETPEWRERFGPFNRPYRERYKPVPFDRSFVRHMEGWYAQKHPDEDFAETFAVWLTPRLALARALPGLARDGASSRYVDRTARALGDTEPPVRLGLHRHHGGGDEHDGRGVLPPAAGQPEPIDVTLEHDLRDLFGRRRRGGRPAVEFLRENRSTLVNKIEYWTGVRRGVVRSLVDRIEDTAARSGLTLAARSDAAALVELTTYATTLAMNHLTHGSFFPRAARRRPRLREEADTHADRHRARA